MEEINLDLEWAREMLGFEPSQEQLEKFKKEFDAYIDNLVFEQDSPLYMV